MYVPTFFNNNDGAVNWPLFVVLIDEICTVLPSGIFSDVTTIVPFATDGSDTASALPAVTLRLFDVVVRERLVVEVFEEAIDTNVLALSVTPEALGEGVREALGETEGFGLADGVGLEVALGVALGDAAGDGVALAVGDGEGVGVATATGKPPPPPELFCAALIEKVFETADAAKNLVVADALAVTVHEPAEVRETLEPATVQLPIAVNTTGDPEEEVAEMLTGPGIICGEIVGKLIVCATFTTLKFFGVRPA